MARTQRSPWRRRKDARPAEILTAALECFGQRGFAATRLTDVAARAGVTKGTLYLYFPSKQELFKAVVRAALIPNIEKLEASIGAVNTAADQLQLLFTTWVEHILPAPFSVIPKLIFAEAGNFPDLARFYLDEVAHRGLRLIASILRRGIAGGEFRPVDVEHVVYSIIAPLLFALLWHHSLGRYADPALDLHALCQAHLELLLRGLAASSPGAPRPKKRRRS
jgi:AcrR family transcriptional regulator